METKVLNVADLNEGLVRDLRDDVVERLVSRIKESGYNPALALTVIKKDGKYIVADGNHRLKALKELKAKDVPCVIFDDADIFSLSVKCNSDTNTYAPLDVFDWLDMIKRMRTEAITQEAIGKRIGWSPKQVSDYNRILNSYSPEVLDIAKKHQKGRGKADSPNGEVDFTEGGLRELIGLNAANQYYVIGEIIRKKWELKGGKLKELCQMKKLHQDMIALVGEKEGEGKLKNEKARIGLLTDINNSVYDDIEQIISKVDELNKEAQKLLFHGDALEKLTKIDDNFIDVVITDPPYGIEYISNRRENDLKKINKPIANDGNVQALALLDKTMALLKTKTKPNAFVYVFTTWKTYPEMKAVIEKYFDVKCALFWDKKNHGSGDLSSWGEQVEMIIFAIKGNKNLIINGDSGRPTNLLSYSRIGQDRNHPMEKPVELLKYLIKKSAAEGDVICDPFMGVGSTIVAANELKHPYVGIELDEKYFKIAERQINELR